MKTVVLNRKRWRIDSLKMWAHGYEDEEPRLEVHELGLVSQTGVAVPCLCLTRDGTRGKQLFLVPNGRLFWSGMRFFRDP